ncbi:MULTISPECIES: PadR family transcriptional regulator [Olsenella]|uniref:PadR family transcriptional regulator n=1 Tax=Olsenella TaxID=133925 RepID=UPI000231EFA5|nr:MULTISPECIES: PadR family transcriptional regulator [Olsenella]EHF02474.1 hypothetical protein HMPREF1008_00119 [Olsenella sp. oral taxon 809 str. F0356]KXB63739.1 transcriptional regulator, PadR family [Olsenella sp. DNF00959]
MDSQFKRGFLDACVLAILAAQDSYGYQIVRDAPPSLELSESTLYPVLRRLEKQGALTEYRSEHNGRLRKYYSITEQGRLQLREFVAERDAIDRLMDFIQKGAEQ